MLSAYWGTRRSKTLQPPGIERFVPIYVVQESILSPVNPLFRHPAGGQDYREQQGSANNREGHFLKR